MPSEIPGIQLTSKFFEPKKKNPQNKPFFKPKTRPFPNNNWLVVSNISYFHPYLGKIPILTNIFQMGWNKTNQKTRGAPPFGVPGRFFWRLGSIFFVGRMRMEISLLAGLCLVMHLGVLVRSSNKRWLGTSWNESPGTPTCQQPFLLMDGCLPIVISNYFSGCKDLAQLKQSNYYKWMLQVSGEYQIIPHDVSMVAWYINLHAKQ